MDTKHHPRRIGGGKFDFTGGLAYQVEARKIFLDNLIRREPRILAELAAEVWPQFARDVETPPDKSDVHPEQEPEMLPGEASEEALKRWAIRWKLTCGWALDQAVATMKLWQVQGQATPDRGWGIFPMVAWASPISDDERQILWPHEGWEPSNQTWAEFERDLDRAYAELKTAYRQYIEKLAQERGGTPVPRKYNLDHFDWLARHHLGESIYRIAKTTTDPDGKQLDWTTVREAIQRTKQLINLTTPDEPRINWLIGLGYKTRQGEQDALPSMYTTLEFFRALSPMGDRSPPS